MHELSLDWKRLLFPLLWLMQTGFFCLFSTIWQRDVARASPFIKPWLTSGYWIVHDSLVRCSVIPSFICKAALLTSAGFGLPHWTCLAMRLSRMSLLISSLFGYRISFLVVGDVAQCSPNSRLWQRCFLGELSLLVPSPSHTWSPYVVSLCYHCGII